MGGVLFFHFLSLILFSLLNERFWGCLKTYATIPVLDQAARRAVHVGHRARRGQAQGSRGVEEGGL